MSLHAYRQYLLMRAKVRLAYRGDVFIHAVGDLLVALIGVVFLWAVFRHVPHIRGWRFAEILLIWGLAEISTGLFFALFQGLWFVNQRYLLQGELDRVLLRPLDPYLQVLLDNINLESLPVSLLGVGMVALALQDLPAVPPGRLLLLPLSVLGGMALLGGLLTGVSAAGFRVHHRGTAVGLVYQGAVFSRYPLDIFHTGLQRLLTYVVPFAFVAYYPAAWCLGRPEARPLYALGQPLLGGLVLLAGVGIWRRGLRSYRSSGS